MNTQMQSQLPEPGPMLKHLDRLVGTWKITGGAQGEVAYEWMEGGWIYPDGGGYQSTARRVGLD
jgi:hypothetical protein